MELTRERVAPAADRRDGGLAVFDLDRTIVAGSSLAVLGGALVRRGLVERRVLLRQAAHAASFRRFGASDATVDGVRRQALAVLAGREVEPFAEAAYDVGVALAADAYPSATWLLRRHVDAGDFCVILTAAPQELADAFASAVGAHRAVGTRLQTWDGRFTGRLDGPLCHGAGKLARLGGELGQFDLDGVTAYADAASDLPLLRRCGSPVAVNPDRKLRRAAAASGWPVLRLS